MKKNITRHLPIIIVFALPLLFVLGIFLFAYLPNRSVETQYNFVYASCGQRSGDYIKHTCASYIARRFDIVDGEIVLQDVEMYDDQGELIDPSLHFDVALFFHDVDANVSTQIDLDDEDALSSFQLEKGVLSPDGVRVTDQQGEHFDTLFFSSSRDREHLYLTKNNAQQQMDVIFLGDSFYSYYPPTDRVRVIGWVKK